MGPENGSGRLTSNTGAGSASILVREYLGLQRLLDGLPRLGIDKLAPADGAFYVYAEVSHLTHDSMSFCHKLLADTGVATAPGVDFDTVAGNNFVRLSFAGSTEQIVAALTRLESWLG